MKNIILIIGISLLSIKSIGQIEFKGGNISIEDDNQNSSAKINIELITSLNSDIDSIEISFGDGSAEWVNTSEQIENLDFDILFSKFTINHQYPGLGHYTISIQNCCWSGEGKNTLGLSNSDFIISREYTVVNPQFSNIGNSPTFMNSFNFIETENQNILVFSPQVFDSEGDSITIELITPIGDSTVQNNYLFPDEVTPSSGNIFSINNLNQVIWESPQEVGEYHFAYELKEYRNGQELSKGNGVSMIMVKEMTSSQKELENNGIKIFPNPVANEITIEIENEIEYLIYNIQGQIILSGKGNNPKINIENFSKGIYILSILQENKKFSEIIMKK